MQEDQIPRLTTTADKTPPNESEANSSLTERDLQVSLDTFSSLSIRESCTTKPKALNTSDTIAREGNKSGEDLVEDIWAPASLDSSNNTSTFYPGSITANTSELGQALREGDLPAALQYLEKEFRDNDEEEGYFTDNSLLEEGESIDSLLLDPNTYATIFDDNQNLEQDLVNTIAQGDVRILANPQEFATLDSALQKLFIESASESFPSNKSGKDVSALKQLYDAEKSQSSAQITLPESADPNFSCIPCPGNSIPGEEQELDVQIDPANFEFGQEESTTLELALESALQTLSIESASESFQRNKSGKDVSTLEQLHTSENLESSAQMTPPGSPDPVFSCVPCPGNAIPDKKEESDDRTDAANVEEGELSKENFEPFIDFSQQQTPPNKPIVMKDELGETSTQQQPPQSKMEPSKAELISGPIIRSFKDRRNKRMLIGHKELVFCLSFSPCGKFIASASQDGTLRVWDSGRNVLISTLDAHGSKHECLRVAWTSPDWCNGVKDLLHSGQEQHNGDVEVKEMLLASAGADGLVKIWQSNDEGHTWNVLSTLNHCSVKLPEEEDQEEEDKQTTDEEDGVPQIYTLGFIDYWQGLPTPRSFFGQGNETEGCSLSVLMTSSDDYIHFWQACKQQPNNQSSIQKNDNLEQQFGLSKFLNFRFTHLEHGFGGVFVTLEQDNTSNQNFHTGPTGKAFGGDRNPNNVVYVFDASHCAANNLLGVALSDGTVRLVNGRGVCVSILQLPGCESHLTSFRWSKDGTKLASCVATGHLILWDIYYGDGKGRILPACRAVLEGGHAEGRPLYGASFCGGEDEDLLLSWGVDGSLCMWDSQSKGQVDSPISILVSDKDYPLYTADIFESKTNSPSGNSIKHIAIGGGADTNFMGNLIFIHDVQK